MSLINGCYILYFHPYNIDEKEIILLSDVTFPSWPGKSANPNFPQYQSYGNIDKFNYYLEIQSKTNVTIFTCTLNPLTLVSNQIHI